MSENALDYPNLMEWACPSECLECTCGEIQLWGMDWFYVCEVDDCDIYPGDEKFFINKKQVDPLEVKAFDRIHWRDYNKLYRIFDVQPSLPSKKA